jgi:hypothetical protein
MPRINIKDDLNNDVTLTYNKWAWWNNTWNRKRQLTINSSLIDSTLTDFPILVKLNSSRINYSLTQDNGEDLRFTDSTESAQLDHEIELWNESGDSYVWVEMPSVASDSDTNFYMYYNNSGASDGQDVAGTWNATFKGVWHMGENLHANDSTLVNNGTINGPTYKRNQNIDGAYSFDGNDDNINVGDITQLNSASAFTLSSWVNQDVLDQADEIFMKYSDANNQIQIYTYTDGKLYFKVCNSGATYARIPDYSNYMSAGTWNHVIFVFDGSQAGNDKQKIYINGVNVPLYYSGTLPSTTADLSSINAYIGYTAVAWDGTIDEVRISNVSHSADWINASYQSETDNLITYGAEDTSYTIPTITIISPENKSYGISNILINTTIIASEGYSIDTVIA